MQQAMFERAKNGYSPEAVNQYIAALTQEYEAKIRETSALATHFKQQNESDRLRLAEVLMQANNTASGIIEKAKQEAAGIIAEAHMETGRIKIIAVEEAMQLRKKLDAELTSVRETFDKITDATEAARQDLLNMFQKVDSTSRHAASMVHIWKQNTPPAPAQSTSYTPEHPSEVFPETNAQWLETMGELLKNVPPPTKAGEHPYGSYVVNDGQPYGTETE